MPERHLCFESSELIGYTSLGLGSHLLPCPLLDPVEFLVDIHFAVLMSVKLVSESLRECGLSATVTVSVGRPADLCDKVGL
jgi:hypothetical protein